MCSGVGLGFFLLAVLFLGGGGPRFALGQGAEAGLRTTEELRSLAPEEATRGRPVQLHGVVTYADAAAGVFWLRDWGVGVRVRATNAAVTTGDLVEVTGQSVLGFAPEARAEVVKRLGSSPLPPPFAVRPDRLNAVTNDAQWVRLAATVTSVQPQAGGCAVSFEARRESLEGFLTLSAGEAAPTNLVGANVFVQGVLEARTNAAGQFAGMRLLVPGAGSLTRSLLGAFRVPTVTNTVADLERRLTNAPNTRATELGGFGILNRPVQVSGMVLFQSRPTRLYCRDETGAFRVELSAAAAFEPGDQIEVVGQAEWVDRQIWINGAVARKTGRGELPAPRRLSVRQMQEATNDGRRVTARGRVVGHQRVTLVGIVRESVALEDPEDGGIWNLRLPDRSGLFARCPVGALVEGTGLEVLSPQQGGPTIPAVYPNSLAEVVLVEPPPFWTPVRLRGLAAIIALVGAGTGVWLLVQRRRFLATAASERRLRSLLQHSFDATFVLGTDGAVKYMTPGAERLLGAGPVQLGDAAGRIEAMLPPEDRSKIADARREVLAEAGRSVRVEQCRLVGPGNEVRWVEAVATNCLQVPGIEGIVVNVHDITERREAFIRLEHSAEVSRRLNEFAGSLSPLHGEDDVLWEITRRCVDLLGFVDCVVYLRDEDRDVLVQRAAFGPKNPREREILNPIEIPLGQGVVGSVAQSAQPALVADTRNDPRYLVDDAARLSELAVPIIADGQVIGVIDSEHPEADFFTAEHLGILTAIAGICANKLVRARAEMRLRDINQELERRIAARTVELVQTNEQLKREVAERRRTEQVQRALFEISEAVHSASDLPGLYARIHEIIGTLMPANNFYLALEDPETGMVSFPYHRDLTDPPPPPRKGRRGMTEYVLRTGRAALADLAEIQRLKDAGEYVQSGHPAAIWLGVPLTVEGRTFGVMAVQDPHDQAAFGEEEKRILSFVAGQTALAIDRKRAEEQLRARTQRLRESEERFSKAFTAIPSNVSIVRVRDQRFVEVNQALLDYSGFSREEVIGRTTQELQIWADEAQRDEFYRRLQADGRVEPMETTLRAKSGRTDTVIIAAETIEVEGEPHILALSVVITERKQAEEELIRSLARERELSRLKSSFVSLVSHEFRTPIGIIHSSAEILERYLPRLPEEERQEHLRAIQSHAWRMAALMEEVLMFGRVEAGRMEFRETEFDLHEICQRWVEEMLLATDSRCPIRLGAPELPRVARGDPDLLRHIVANLLSNAVKYSPPGRAVELELQRDGAMAVICVTDRGLGIPASSRERLFTAFQRGENVRHLPGTGLGLVVIRHCLDLHRGTIELDSAENVGTRVVVRVPLFEQVS